MQIPDGSIGEYNEDGSVKTDATADLISGLSVRGQHATTQGIPGTRKFFRILAENVHYFTEEVRAALFQQLGAVQPTAPDATPVPEPAADETAKEN